MEKKLEKKIGWEKYVSKSLFTSARGDNINPDATISSDATKISITKDDINKIVGNIIKRYQKHVDKQKDKDKTKQNDDDEKDKNNNNKNEKQDNKDNKNEEQLQQQSQ